MNKSPDQELSERILKRLRDEKLLSDEKIAELAKSYTTGDMKSEDWKLLAGLSWKKGNGNGKKNSEDNR